MSYQSRRAEALRSFTRRRSAAAAGKEVISLLVCTVSLSCDSRSKPSPSDSLFDLSPRRNRSVPCTYYAPTTGHRAKRSLGEVMERCLITVVHLVAILSCCKAGPSGRRRWRSLCTSDHVTETYTAAHATVHVGQSTNCIAS